MGERATFNGKMFEEEKNLVKYFVNHGFNVEAEKDYGFSIYRKGEDTPCALQLTKTELYAFLKDNSRFERPVMYVLLVLLSTSSLMDFTLYSVDGKVTQNTEQRFLN